MAQDYNKIFASGASSTQEWTDENYLKGWGYLGQTPPPYQLFDALFKRLDLKTQELNSNQNNIANNYLPLTGGTMDGLLSLFAGSTIPTPDAGDNSQKIVNSEWVQALIKNIISDLSENLEVQWSGSTFTVPALGITGLMAQNGYICLGKLFGGLILQWGLFVGDDRSYMDITYPIAFKNSAFQVMPIDIYYQENALIGPGEVLCVIANKVTKNTCRIVTSKENPGSIYCFFVGV